MQNIRKFTVVPSLPTRIERLKDIAYNLWWTWEPEALHLWRRMDLDLWEEVYHNPVKLLGVISQTRLKELCADDSFLAHLDRVAEKLDNYINGTTWYDCRYSERESRTIAYFSFEYGLAESFPVYSGGLGILSGDHLKSASELGLPLVGVGLLYRRGYFRQYLNTDGWQQEYLPELDFYTMPVTPVQQEDGKPTLVKVQIKSRPVHARVWQVQVGRIPLYLLDTNLEINHAEDREITAQLYGGDTDMRIKQEYLLGIGGYRALTTMGIAPSVCHMNEGHAAFLTLERIRTAMETQGLDPKVARATTCSGNVFTTHTPVPAGNDRFPMQQLEPFFREYLKGLKMPWEEFVELGRENPKDQHEAFCMTVLALKLSSHANGVSELHGHVSRKMWQQIWPQAPAEEVPINHITNGVHIGTWISGEMTGLLDRYLGERWSSDPIDETVWERVARIPDAELWRTHERRAERLVSFVRRRLRQQLTRRGLPPAEIQSADEVLDPDCLTIGFARRFATYKRGTLLFRNLERLSSLVGDSERPVQMVFAGKAHPADGGGKELIRQIAHFCRQPQFRRRVVFIEDYDMNVARYMIQGVDIWLNTPRRPLEASGTSGMKAAANGVLNLSILDGWWCEGYSGDNGWVIGTGEEYQDAEYQDQIESEALYEILEKDVIPLYYERGRDDLPRNWIQRMKRSIMTCAPVFNTNRMLRDYSELFYFPAADQYLRMVADDADNARRLVKWQTDAIGHWGNVSISDVKSDVVDEVVQVGNDIPLNVGVALNKLSPEDVRVEVYYGQLDSVGNIPEGKVMRLEFARKDGDGNSWFSGTISPSVSGRFGFIPRVMPCHEDLPIQDCLTHLRWG